MVESTTASANAGKIKIQRTRKRLYETSESSVQEPAQESAQDLAQESQAGATAPPAETETAPSSVHKQAHYARARRLVDYHAALASTAGLIPMPVVDMVLVGALQLKLIRDLSRHYQVTFSKERAKALTASLLGGVQTGLISSSTSKYIPAVGALATIPTALGAGAITYGIGRVFIYHFELGGTLLDFNSDKMRAYFQQQLNQKSSKTTKAND